VKGKERGIEAAATTPGNPGSGYVLDWDNFACRTAPELFDGQAGWRKDYLAPSEVQHPPDNEPAFRTACAPDPVRSGQLSARFHLTRNDPEVPGSGSKRAELRSAPIEPRGAKRWYGFSIYLGDWAHDSAADIVTQWHHRPGTGSPPLSLGTKNGQWQISVPQVWDYTISNPTASTPAGPYAAGRWTDWVVHVHWSASDTDGLLSIWKDGNPVPGFANRKGRTAYQDEQGQVIDNYMKIGIYKWPWNTGSSQPGNATQRIMYHDEVRIADQDQGGTYYDVSPPGTLRNFQGNWTGTGTVYSGPMPTRQAPFRMEITQNGSGLHVIEYHNWVNSSGVGQDPKNVFDATIPATGPVTAESTEPLSGGGNDYVTNRWSLSLVHPSLLRFDLQTIYTTLGIPDSFVTGYLVRQ
jgi:hypothetical protein